MADNVAITSGSGTTIAADEVVDSTLGTVKAQFVKIYDGTLDSTNKLVVDSSGRAQVSVGAALPAGSNVIGLVTPTPGTAGGWSKVKYTAQTTTVQTVKATAGTFGGYFIANPSAAFAYLQVFDVATATTVTLGTTSPDMIFGIPASSSGNLEITLGVNMANGIKIAVTTTSTGLTAPATGAEITIFYK